MPLDQRELDDVLDLLRHSSPGERRQRQLVRLHELVVDAGLGWQARSDLLLLRKLEWSAWMGPLVDKQRACPACGLPQLGEVHTRACSLAKSLVWHGAKVRIE